MKMNENRQKQSKNEKNRADSINEADLPPKVGQPTVGGSSTIRERKQQLGVVSRQLRIDIEFLFLDSINPRSSSFRSWSFEVLVSQGLDPYRFSIGVLKLENPQWRFFIKGGDLRKVWNPIYNQKRIYIKIMS
ncbi:hypothetical protein M9H77_08706 [Catharanthus roseus]|uniref:Uncharacterized protein n=1 Tax=Catharanthus roseus TaxID=4058 RepID=A0ACC0BYY1_CATRO|nr:hypothetical protein M9H77_08706 [Catharanthus roseus]